MDMEKYQDLIRKSKDYKETREERYKQISKDRLLKISQKKIETTMIGALSIIEQHFGFLWGYGSEEALTPEQEHMREQFSQIRSEILDKGNNQSRNLEGEFANYDINWRRYEMTIPVKSLEGDEDAGTN